MLNYDLRLYGMKSREIEERKMASKSTEEEKLHGTELDDDIKDDLSTAIKLMYDRDTPGYKPKDLEYCKPLVDLAIVTYNQQHSTHYRLVELIRVIGCVCSGFYFFMKYSATDSDSDADAKMFAADVFDGI
ncbi:hypothetical protein MIMGU_mgv1a016212mg [Erythranthe guttata]|uniref:Uncharacterized protein n=1 Tax=Erythranthe guttata TaxID=4155 RepID=A0A022PW75_ERYGU|nr:PREDICTED: uncharacterized protein LOC105977654 isoform X1 [Erythranthe guttata]EYU20046.1 hypothetical protein MIMGU_mgv1a016212mg [Erythranthe guttata]EYU20047.1 hypothetical protein MIMGU_mgv1a016212mg [Erythranthe guttata]|eukprot:XP_012858443.1 PREDICTED: uncharacterized protein LOC105977654 isoform X1 [Erythranthe guttata]